ncbi:hypothetical protein K469DRAFT_690561 [Zopfia rhizophila CBS 207.26]|uniref:Uncharacterized protein n=1 Tax=Zopfia rhizophila CBS 207.26 TaxID=1314779 RepID=A0A6A6DXX6_9PEZI|nr:hypothetical protein K469DRAFT_690561 [Zopfia rhizophila CBS 207.26]
MPFGEGDDLGIVWKYSILRVDIRALFAYPTSGTTLPTWDSDSQHAPPYVILSHRWRENEVTFEDFQYGGKCDEVELLINRVRELELLVQATAKKVVANVDKSQDLTIQNPDKIQQFKESNNDQFLISNQ